MSSGRTIPDRVAVVWAAFALLAGAAFVLFLAVRANYRSTVRVRWVDIDHFEVRRLGALVAVRIDGTAVRLRDYAPFRSASLGETARALNEELVRQKEGRTRGSWPR